MEEAESLNFILTPTWSVSDQDEVQSHNKGSAGAPGGLKKQLKAKESKGRRETINPWDPRNSAVHVLGPHVTLSELQ